MEVKETKDFKKDFKKLAKHYPSLKNDLEVLVMALKADPTGNGARHWNILKTHEEHYILKVRMMCRSVKGKSFRVIYYYDGACLELECIEIYYKALKQREDQERIETFWKQRVSI